MCFSFEEKNSGDVELRAQFKFQVEGRLERVHVEAQEIRLRSAQLRTDSIRFKNVGGGRSRSRQVSTELESAFICTSAGRPQFILQR